MVLLNKNSYYKAVEPLMSVNINNLFARAVVQHVVNGTVYVDNEMSPQTFYVIHPYGMSLLFGRSDNDDFNDKFIQNALSSNRSKFEWLQVYPDNWDNVLSKLLKDKLTKESNIDGVVELNTRVNFKFDEQKYLSEKETIEGVNILRTDANMFAKMEGSVVPLEFWTSANGFVEQGVGFSLFVNDELASTAFSACVFDNMLEIGIETNAKFRGKGFAYHCCSALINYCLNNNLEPVWACRKENIGSYKLAQKLGFVVNKEISYYRLPK